MVHTRNSSGRSGCSTASRQREVGRAEAVTDGRGAAGQVMTSRARGHRSRPAATARSESGERADGDAIGNARRVAPGNCADLARPHWAALDDGHARHRTGPGSTSIWVRRPRNRLIRHAGSERPVAILPHRNIDFVARVMVAEPCCLRFSQCADGALPQRSVISSRPCRSSRARQVHGSACAASRVHVP
jgi:hypothetical protein